MTRRAHDGKSNRNGRWLPEDGRVPMYMQDSALARRSEMQSHFLAQDTARRIGTSDAVVITMRSPRPVVDAFGRAEGQRRSRLIDPLFALANIKKITSEQTLSGACWRRRNNCVCVRDQPPIVTMTRSRERMLST